MTKDKRTLKILRYVFINGMFAACLVGGFAFDVFGSFDVFGR